MDVQELISKFSGKKTDEKAEEPIRELIKFKEGVLDKYPCAELNLLVYPSSFGIHITTTASKEKKDEKLMEGMVIIHSDEDNLKCLLTQLIEKEKKTELEKYNRIKNQNSLIAMYRRKNNDPEFIKNMLASMPIEYEVQVRFTPKKCKEIETQTIKIYIDNIDDANKIEKNLELFRENAMCAILDETISSFSKEEKTKVSC